MAGNVNPKNRLFFANSRWTIRRPDRRAGHQHSPWCRHPATVTTFALCEGDCLLALEATFIFAIT